MWASASNPAVRKSKATSGPWTHSKALRCVPEMTKIYLSRMKYECWIKEAKMRAGRELGWFYSEMAARLALRPGEHTKK